MGKRTPAKENKSDCHAGIVRVIASIIPSTIILSGKSGPEAKSNN